MRTFELEIREHESYGTLGFQIKGRSWAEPGSAMTLAHDILEHFPNDRGSTEEEFMALGASLFVRNEGEYHAQKNAHNCDPGYQMSGDIEMQTDYMMQRGESIWIRSPGRTEACAMNIEGYISTALEFAMKESRSRSDDGRPEEWLRPENHWKARGWMRRGYRKAQRRYKGIDRSHLCQVFLEIERHAERVLRFAEECQQFIVKVDVDQGYVKVIEVQEDFD